MSLSVTKNLLLQVIRKDEAGRTVRISSYMKTNRAEKPVSEQIYYPDGRSTLYLYNEDGEKIDRVARIDKIQELPNV